MMIDHELALCTKGGQLFNPGDGSDEYGAKEIDLGIAGIDPAVGEPLDFFVRVTTADLNNLTSYTVALVADSTTGSVTAEQVLCTKTILLAALLQNTLHKIGRVSPGLGNKRYLKMKVTQTGTTPTTGLLEGWLAKACGSVPSNAVHA